MFEITLFQVLPSCIQANHVSRFKIKDIAIHGKRRARAADLRQIYGYFLAKIRAGCSPGTKQSDGFMLSSPEDSCLPGHLCA